MRLVLSAFCLLALSTPAFAQQNGADMDYGAIMAAKQGAWAEYTMTVKGLEKPMKMRYALVEKNDKKMAVEISTDTPMGPMDIRMEWAPAEDGGWKVTSGKMKMGAQSADLPAEQLAKTPHLKKGGDQGKLIGTEKITTAAGVFDAKHFRKIVKTPQGDLTVDTWVNEGVAPTGLVQSTADAKGLKVVLAATGKDAVSKMK